MATQIASNAMQWPPVHGGPIYWFLRGSLFKSKRFNRRLMRIVIENYDRQRLKNMMFPRLSYDHRVNHWMQSFKLRGAAGVAGTLGDTALRNSLQPCAYVMSFFWINHEIWKQEKHPFQSWLKWRKVHQEERARKATLAEDEEED